MKTKIITKENAVELGLSTPTDAQARNNESKYIYGIVGKLNVDGEKTKDIQQTFRVNIKTKKMEILSETKEYKRILNNKNE